MCRRKGAGVNEEVNLGKIGRRDKGKGEEDGDGSGKETERGRGGGGGESVIEAEQRKGVDREAKM